MSPLEVTGRTSEYDQSTCSYIARLGSPVSGRGSSSSESTRVTSGNGNQNVQQTWHSCTIAHRYRFLTVQ